MPGVARKGPPGALDGRERPDRLGWRRGVRTARMVMANDRAVALWHAFKIGRTEYRWIDFGLVAGHPQIYEINTAVHKRYRGRTGPRNLAGTPRPERLRTHGLAAVTIGGIGRQAPPILRTRPAAPVRRLQLPHRTRRRSGPDEQGSAPLPSAPGRRPGYRSGWSGEGRSGLRPQ